MAPTRISGKTATKKSLWREISSKYLTVNFVKSLIFDPARLPWVSYPILLAELFINIFIVMRINYTEIDWVAYMQQCESFINGTTDYSQLKGKRLKFRAKQPHSNRKILFLGDTGPLVYPAFFVYIYTFFYFITSQGKNIRLAQFIFVGIYLLQLWLVLRLYSKSRKIPPFVVVLSVFTSYRIHSIYSLRLFNDPIAILLLYAALDLFLERKWSWGSVLFSLGVGVKMNILLFAPAVLMLYITSLGYAKTIVQLSICAVVQLIIGAPFLLTHPISYLKGSFDLGRVFEQKWTVNYRFLSRAVFENSLLHIGLLVAHVALLLYVAKPCYQFFKNYARLRSLQAHFQPQIDTENRKIEEECLKKKTKKAKVKEQDETLTDEQKSFLKSFESGLKNQIGDAQPNLEIQSEESSKKVEIHFDQCIQLALLPIFLANFIGLVFARSLHYQFYVWYFHSLPYLSWFTDYRTWTKILLLALIEFCWNQYPSTIFSSILLHICHLTLLVGVIQKLFRETRLAKQATSQKDK